MRRLTVSGTIVERLAPGVYEVEFSDDEGRTYASLPLRADQLLQLHHQHHLPDCLSRRDSAFSAPLR